MEYPCLLYTSVVCRVDDLVIQDRLQEKSAELHKTPLYSLGKLHLLDDAHFREMCIRDRSLGSTRISSVRKHFVRLQPGSFTMNLQYLQATLFSGKYTFTVATPLVYQPTPFGNFIYCIPPLGYPLVLFVLGSSTISRHLAN